MLHRVSIRGFASLFVVFAGLGLAGCDDDSSGGPGPSLPELDRSGLLALLHFNEPAGADTFANSASDTLSGNCVLCPESGVAGKFGNAIHFAGGDSAGSVSIPLAPIHAAPGDEATFAWWMKWDGMGAGDSTLTDCDFWAMPLYLAGVDVSVAFHNGHFGLNSWNCDLRGVSSVGLEDRWVHVAVILHAGDLTQARLFLDGVPQTLAQVFETPTDSAGVSGEVFLGFPRQGKGENYPMSGEIDEFVVFNRALSPDEIDLLYSMGELPD